MSINTHTTPKENLEEVADGQFSPDGSSDTPIDEATVHPAIGWRFVHWSRHRLSAVRQRLAKSQILSWLRPQLATLWRALVITLAVAVVVALFYLWRRSPAFRMFVLTTATNLYHLPDRVGADLTPPLAQAISVEANN